MGAITFSIDVHLVEFLSQYFSFDYFIETGTFRGDTLESVKAFFPQLLSIEASEEYYRLAVSRFQHDSSIAILQGDSGKMLAEIMPSLSDKSILFWLDAHWCEVENTAGEISQCPILQELRAIQCLNEHSVLLIDDARFYLCPPGKPHEYSQWPDFARVMRALHSLSDKHKLMAFNDVLVYYPQAAQCHMQSFAHEYGVDWLGSMVKSREYDSLLQEIQSKEQEIQKLTGILKNREEIIQLQHKELVAHEYGVDLLDSMVKRCEYDSLLQEIQSKEQEIQRLTGILKNREEIIQLQHKELVAHEGVMQALIVFQRSSLRYWCGHRPKVFLKHRLPEHIQDKIRHIRREFESKLGQLRQYAPVPLKIPEHYSDPYRLSHQALPVVSVVTPSLNQAQFLEQTIKSMLDQHYPRLEYIIQDGASTDATGSILQQYAGKVTYIESAKDTGQANAINRGFCHATGDIMAWLNSDDLLLPGALTYIANFFLEHPDVDVVYGHRIIINDQGHEIGRWILPPHDKNMLLWADYVPQETLFWRREIWERAGGYIDESFHFALDWDLLLRFREAKARFVRLPRFLAAFRVHDRQKTSQHIETQGFQEMYRLRERCHARHVSHEEAHTKIRHYLRKQALYDLAYRLKLLRH